MASARGDALDWALALARAPGERHALRQRPLPDGIETLLQIAAAGHGGTLQAAVARTGESEAELVEAVRFYLREVLFHSGADAYRMLGLAHDASNEQIKGHHRLLQQWLHPDRHSSDWDAIFAGRVNAAWNALRTPERRAAHDASHPVVTERAHAATRWAGPRVMAGAPIPVDAPADRWRRRAPVLALFAACGVLGIAAVRDALREPDSSYRAETAKVTAPDDADPVALQLPKPAPRATRGERATPPRRAASTASRRVATPAPAPSPRPPAGSPRPPTPGVAALTGPLATSSRPPAAMPPPRQAAAAAAPIPIPTPTPLPMPVAAAVAAPASITPSAASPIRAPVRVALAPTVAPPAVTPIEPAVVPAAAAATASPERVQQAQRTGRQLLAFLSAPGGAVPPIWDSLAAQQRAVRLRDSLHASGDTRAGDPQWRVSLEGAALQAAFGDDAQVRAQLVWREQRWLVSGVALEQAP